MPEQINGNEDQMTYEERVREVAEHVRRYPGRLAPRSATHRAKPLMVQGVFWCDVWDYVHRS